MTLTAEETTRMDVAFRGLQEALSLLLEDTQHADHDCGDVDYCPVVLAEQALERSGWVKTKP